MVYFPHAPRENSGEFIDPGVFSGADTLNGLGDMDVFPHYFEESPQSGPFSLIQSVQSIQSIQSVQSVQ